MSILFSPSEHCISKLTDYSQLLKKVSSDILIECGVYIHILSGKLVQYSDFSNGTYTFYDFNDHYYYEKNCQNIYRIEIDINEINPTQIPTSDFQQLFESYKSLTISQTLKDLQTNIQISLFTSLYTCLLYTSPSPRDS